MTRRLHWTSILIATLYLSACTAVGVLATELQDNLAIIRGVRSDGSSNRRAAAAWREVVQSSPEQLDDVLAAIDESTPLAANWLRSAVDSIAERTQAAGQPLPLEALERFALSTEHDGRARRLAYEWLRRAKPETADRLIPAFLHDESAELRRDAVARLMDAGQESLSVDAKGKATATYREALSGARDTDQVKEIVKQLRALDQTVDLPMHFGFLMKWQVIGPFDNSGRAGFGLTYPPELEYELSKVYQGKDGKVQWRELETKDDFGMVDLNQPFGSLKETVAYARTEFHSERGQQVELRLGCKNAWKVWLNGELLFGREEYHRGIEIDQYLMPAKLRAGNNIILVKACQSEEIESWTVEWEFQLRVCDTTGTAIHSTDRGS